MFSALLTRTKYIGTGTPTPPGPDYSVPLTIKMNKIGTFYIDRPQKGMQISINGAAKKIVDSRSYKVNEGDIICLYGDEDKITNYEGTKIYADNSHIVYGNIMSLVDEFGYISAITIPSEQCFANLFQNDNKLLSAKDLLLPATELAPECYREMFIDCENLEHAPVLPATSLEPACYKRMFINCTCLRYAPVLPATELAPACYMEMFVDCTCLRYIKCLATSGIATNSSTENWMENAGIEEHMTKVFTAATGSIWPTSDNSGIPDGWTRENV